VEILDALRFTHGRFALANHPLAIHIDGAACQVIECVAIGSQGILLLGHTLFGTKVSFMPWSEVNYMKLRSFNTLGYILQLTPRLLGLAISDNYQYSLSVVLHALQAGWRQYQAEQKVTIENIRHCVEPVVRKGKRVLSFPLPLHLMGPIPNELQQVVSALSNRQYYDGMRTHCWNRTARSLFRWALLMLFSIPTFLGVLVTAPLFVAAFLYRGPKAGWFVSFLPEGLLLWDDKGFRSVPWAQVQNFIPQGRRVLIQTSSGTVSLEPENFGLEPSFFIQQCQGLQSLARPN